MAAQSLPYLTPEQYLEIERKAETKSEYLRGAMYAMAGGSFAHNVILGNLVFAVKGAVKGKPCSVHFSDLRLCVSSSGLYTYPDAMIVCGPPQFADNRNDTVTNPIIIFEILSPSSEAYDRGVKFSHYRGLESLEEYILISQSEPRIERFHRLPGNRWILSESAGLEAAMELESIPCRLTLAEIYDKVEFSSASAAAPSTPEGSAS
ncbi:MAG: Uma2 family endonuclease [Bryobacterales bacterium]|nr:Uma2 family endonuclease [Bryobacterales bacterium]